ELLRWEIDDKPDTQIIEPFTVTSQRLWPFSKQSTSHLPRHSRTYNPPAASLIHVCSLEYRIISVRKAEGGDPFNQGSVGNEGEETWQASVSSAVPRVRRWRRQAMVWRPLSLKTGSWREFAQSKTRF